MPVIRKNDKPQKAPGSAGSSSGTSPFGSLATDERPKKTGNGSEAVALFILDTAQAPMSVSTALGGDICSPIMIVSCMESDVLGGSGIYSALGNLVGSNTFFPWERGRVQKRVREWRESVPTLV